MSLQYMVSHWLVTKHHMKEKETWMQNRERFIDGIRGLSLHLHHYICADVLIKHNNVANASICKSN